MTAIVGEVTNQVARTEVESSYMDKKTAKMIGLEVRKLGPVGLQLLAEGLPR